MLSSGQLMRFMGLMLMCLRLEDPRNAPLNLQQNDVNSSNMPLFQKDLADEYR